jgi:hypothetical protein
MTSFPGWTLHTSTDRSPRLTDARFKSASFIVYHMSRVWGWGKKPPKHSSAIWREKRVRLMH